MTAERATARRDPEATRESLIQAAYEEIHRHGFQAASLDTILKKAGVTKGALYHHFGSKIELGYAVLESVVTAKVTDSWLKALETGGDPIDALIGTMNHPLEHLSASELELGCPLLNLSQEMSPLDEGFRTRVARIFDLWRQTISDHLARGQKTGAVRSDVDTQAAAAFIVASYEGAIGLAKNSRDVDLFATCIRGLTEYLEGLRPTH